MSTAIVTSDTSEDHITGDGHPEQPKEFRQLLEIKKEEKSIMG